MNSDDPVIEDLQRMFDQFEGPADPIHVGRRRPFRRRAMSRQFGIAIGLATLLLGASLAVARERDLFEGPPAPDVVKSQIATDSTGAPPALDPGIEAGTTVTMISLPVPEGTATLYVSAAKKATYCMGVAFSWLGGKAGLGCTGPAGGALPAGPSLAINFGINIPGALGTSPTFVYGHINDPSATSARINLDNGSSKALVLTHGFFLTRLEPGANPTSIDALDAHMALVATQTIRLPSFVPKKNG
jgi:hypothetical protein